MGRRLEKFSLRHRFWLEALKSPMVMGGESRMMDIEMASRVCAMRFEDLERKLAKVIGRGPTWCGKLGYLWKIFRRGADVEYLKFQEYLLDHGCPPATWEGEVVQEGDAPQDSGALPGVFGLVTGLIRGANWEPDVVWALSPGEAEWYLAGVFMHRGVDVGIKTAEDEAMEEFLAAREEKKEADGE